MKARKKQAAVYKYQVFEKDVSLIGLKKLRIAKIICLMLCHISKFNLSVGFLTLNLLLVSNEKPFGFCPKDKAKNVKPNTMAISKQNKKLETKQKKCKAHPLSILNC